MKGKEAWGSGGREGMRGLINGSVREERTREEEDEGRRHLRKGRKKGGEAWGKGRLMKDKSG